MRSISIYQQYQAQDLKDSGLADLIAKHRSEVRLESEVKKQSALSQLPGQEGK